MDRYREKASEAMEKLLCFPSSSPSSSSLPTEEAEVVLRVNGKEVKVDPKLVAPSLSLARFLRVNLGLTGTKVSCAQGRCGACTVSAVVAPAGGRDDGRVLTVNACLVPVLHCRGWDITTVEGLGSCREGLSAVQKRLVDHCGTQCGFCTPGMVMAMNSLLKNEVKPSKEAVENCLDGNICRCTGYRPILDAFKTFSSEGEGDLATIPEIEDLCRQEPDKKSSVPVVPSRPEWFYPRSVEDVFKVLAALPEGAKHLFVAGHTGMAIFSGGPYDALVDLSLVSELKVTTTEPELSIGATVSISECVRVMEEAAKDRPGEYGYCSEVATHYRGVANQGVRDVGTVAGNLCLLRQSTEEPDFPSDVALLLEAVGARVNVVSSAGKRKSGKKVEEHMSVAEFLALRDMDRKIVSKIVLPKLNEDHVFRSYKVRRRRQNCQALVNAAFLLPLRGGGADGAILGRPSIVFGGLRNKILRASETESLLEAHAGQVGREVLGDQETADKLFHTLDRGCDPGDIAVLANPEYRRHLATALFYKFVLDVLGAHAPAAARTGALPLSRGVSSGHQRYRTDPSLYPLNEPVPKLESWPQCTGEARYVDDLPLEGGGGGLRKELHGAFVLSTVAACEIDQVDPTDALKIPGVVAFLDYRDIPGRNNCTRSKLQPEEIFSSGKIHYAGQAIGLLVAESTETAHRAAREAVRVTYKNRRRPVVDLEEAIAKEDRREAEEARKILLEHDVEAGGGDLTVVEGQFRVGSQYHFHLETQSCVARPTAEAGERTMELEAATQWMDKVQLVAAQALDWPEHRIAVKVRRLGGAYGGKISRPNQVAAAAAVAADKLDRPVRVVMDFRSNMEMMGKRLPYLAKYKVGVNSDGRLQRVNMDVSCDCGFTTNETTAGDAVVFAQNCYSAGEWDLRPVSVKTDTAANTFCRAPGTTQGHAIIENVMEHLSVATGVDPTELRMRNMLHDGDALVSGGKFEGENPLPQIVEDLKRRADYEGRKIDRDKFNEGNLWKKRGLSLVPVRYFHAIPTTRFYVRVVVYHADGTVAVSHGGIEMGQGINTKVAQVVASELGVNVSLVAVRATDNFVSPNNTATDASNGSECVCAAAKTACEDLKRRMAPYQEEGQTWTKFVHQCYREGVNLTAEHMGSSLTDDLPSSYDVWGAALTEVEVDVLTGELNVCRVDLTEDTGTSVNPAVDVGQVEGALSMSLGLWTTEEIKFDEKTGRLLTYDAWDYFPYSSKDIPELLNVDFYDGKRDNPPAFLGAKCTGEPPFLLGVSVLFAIRDAINSVRRDLGRDPKEWYSLDGPATVEKIQTTTGVSFKHFIVQ